MTSTPTPVPPQARNIHHDGSRYLASTAVTSLLSYLASLALVHLFAPAMFSVYSAAAGVLTLLGVVSSAGLSWATARLLAGGDVAGARRLALLVAPVYMLGAAVTGWVVVAAYAPLEVAAATAVSGAVVVAGSVAAGWMQGLLSLTWLAVGRVLEAALRAGVTIAAGLAGLVGVAVAGVGVGAAALAAFGVLALALAHRRTGVLAGARSGQAARAPVLATAAGAVAVQGLTVLATLVAVLSVAIHLGAPSAQLGDYQAMTVLTRVPVLIAGALAVAMFVPLAGGDLAAGQATLTRYVRLGAVIALGVATVPAPLLDVLLGRHVTVDRVTLVALAVAGFAGGALSVLTAAAQARGSLRMTVLVLAAAVGTTAILAPGAWAWGGPVALAYLDATVLVVAVLVVARLLRRPVPRLLTGFTALVWAAVLVPLAGAAALPGGVGIALWCVVALVAGLTALLPAPAPRGDVRALRVLHLAYESPNQPGAGGGSERTAQVDARLAAAGHHVVALHRRYPGATRTVRDGVVYRPVGPRVFAHSPFLATIAYFVTVFLTLPVWLRRTNPDVIVDDFGAPITCLPLRWLTTRPIVGVAQWADAAGKAAQYKLPFHWVEALGLRGQRDIIAVSADAAASLTARAPHATLHVIPNGLPGEVDEPRRPVTLEGWRAGRVEAVFLGRLDIAQKGLDTLLEGWADLVARPGHEQDRLWLVGEGPDAGVLARQVSSLGLTGSVRFTGRIDGAARLDVLADAAVVVMPSRYETFGMVAAEALAVGTPLVVSDLPVLSVFVAEQTALAVPVAAGPLADALATVLGTSGDTLRAAAATAGPALVAGYDWDLIAAQVEQVLVAARRTVTVVAHPTDEVIADIFRAGEPTLVVGNYGNANTGDEAILARLVELMDPAAAVTVASRNHGAITARHHLPAVSLTSGAGVATWWRAKRVVVGGGGMFGPGQPLLVSLLPLVLVGSRLLGKRIGFAGIGAYAGMPALSRGILALAARMADHVIVRDEPATRVLDLPWGPDRIDLIPDTGFGLATDHVAAAKVLAAAKVRAGVPFLLISPKAGQEAHRTDAMLRTAAGAARAWAARGGQVGMLLLSDKGEYGLGRGGSDAVLAARIATLAGVPVLTLGPDLDPQVAKGVVAAADAVVGMRFHALVFAAATNVPMAGLAFESKSAALMADHPGFTLTPNQLTDDALTGWVEQVYPGQAGAGRAAHPAGRAVRPLQITSGVAVLVEQLRPVHPRLSIVLPSYNTTPARLVDTVTRALAVAGKTGEVIVVDDGSTNGSAHALAALTGPLLVVRQPNGGKGSALRTGFALARGTWVGMVDADGQYAPEELPSLVKAATKAHALAAVGRRDLRAANYSLLRRGASWAFRTWTRMWLRPTVADTQAGIKVVSGSLMPLLLPELTENTFAFDVDLLAALSRLDADPVAAPVSFIHDDESTVTMGRGASAFVGVVEVALRHYKAVAASVPAGELVDVEAHS